MPEFFEMNMYGLFAAMSLEPSADEAIGPHTAIGAPDDVQSIPEFVEVWIELPIPAAANLPPSADKVTDVHRILGALVTVQIAPELLETYMFPTKSLRSAATHLLPSAMCCLAVAIAV